MAAKNSYLKFTVNALLKACSTDTHMQDNRIEALTMKKVFCLMKHPKWPILRILREQACYNKSKRRIRSPFISHGFFRMHKQTEEAIRTFLNQRHITSTLLWFWVQQPKWTAVLAISLLGNLTKHMQIYSQYIKTRQLKKLRGDRCVHRRSPEASCCV